MSIILIGTDNHIPGNELDSLTRKKFRKQEEFDSQIDSNSLTYLVIILALVAGIIIGNTMHDWLFHGVDHLLRMKG